MQDTPQKQFVCHFFVNLSNLRTQSNGDFYKNFIWPFLCIPRVVLFITTYFGHSTTKNSLKYQIWNFAFWVDKMSQNRAIFFEIALYMMVPKSIELLFLSR